MQRELEDLVDTFQERRVLNKERGQEEEEEEEEVGYCVCGC